MGTFLFDKIIFGPVYSRRLGQSLGINLLPVGLKICTFNCVYCECGWTKSVRGKFVSIKDFTSALEFRFHQIAKTKEQIDTITFAGNGEPTIHPDFEEIIDITIELRNRFLPTTDIAVLSNSTSLVHVSVVNALNKIEKRIMKLDAGSEQMFQLINKPKKNITLNEIVSKLSLFNGNIIIQTLLLRGNDDDQVIDNSTEEELTLLGNHLQKIKPQTVMLYSIARGTPLETLQAVTQDELLKAAQIIRQFIPQSVIYIF